MLKLLVAGLYAVALWAQGRPATAEEIKRRDLAVFADGRGLPVGKGSAVRSWRMASDGTVAYTNHGVPETTMKAFQAWLKANPPHDDG